MPVPSNVIFMWPGANDAIPAGWSREITLDDRYVKGTAAGVNPNVTGGTATHTHTTASHTHTHSSHSHTGSIIASTDSPMQSGTTNAATNTHTHTYTSGAVTPTGSSDASSASWDSLSNDPSFFKAIFIKSNGTPLGIPDSGMAFNNSSTHPT